MNCVNFQEPALDSGTLEREKFNEVHSKLGAKPRSTIRFFNRTDCYTVHGEDCETVSKIVYKSTKFIHNTPKGVSEDIPYVVLSKLSFEHAARELLLVRNFRVEVYGKHAHGKDFHLEFRGSPGNLLQFENILFGNKDFLVNNIIISLQIRPNSRERKIGIASVDQNNCLFQLLEFSDEDVFTALEAIIVLLSPKECLLPSFKDDYAAVKTLLERNGVMVTITSDEKNDVIKDLNVLIRFSKGQQADASVLPETKLEIAMEALRLAISYLDLTKNSSNKGHYNLNHLNPNRFVHLNSAAVNALNILPQSATTFASKSYNSVLDLLDYCCTPQGHRLIKQWILQPLRNIEILNDRHNIVQCFLESSNTVDMLRENLRRIPDILMLTNKMIRHRATLQDLFRIYQTMLRGPKISNTLLELKNPTVKSVLYDSLKIHLEDLAGLKNMVEQVVDLECVDNGEYYVKQTFDEHLTDLKNRMSSILSKMERLQSKATTDLNLVRGQHVRLENVLHIGYHFRITLKDDSSLRKIKKYTVIDVVKGGVRFTIEKLKNLNDEFQELSAQYKEHQKSIVEEVLQVAAGYATPLISLNNELAQLDCLVSFAKAALSAPFPYVRPEMLQGGNQVLELKDLRHPCLEMRQNLTYIPNDVAFKKDICNMMIITGPNMGGKSTYIRSVGAAVLMAHVGSFVPCSRAVIPMVDCILARIGANDNFIKGLSTFMVEMIETSSIIKNATESSLVIIDELGRGTSTYEGCGIAWSIAEHLAKEIRCFTLFATHFTEITQLTKTVSSVRNYHMVAVADESNFTLLYQLRPGAMEKSFGIQVARLANLPVGILQDAQVFYKELEGHLETMSVGNGAALELINEAIAHISRQDITENDLNLLVEKLRTLPESNLL